MTPLYPSSSLKERAHWLRPHHPRAPPSEKDVTRRRLRCRRQARRSAASGGLRRKCKRGSRGTMPWLHAACTQTASQLETHDTVSLSVCTAVLRWQTLLKKGRSMLAYFGVSAISTGASRRACTALSVSSARSTMSAPRRAHTTASSSSTAGGAGSSTSNKSGALSGSARSRRSR